MMKAKLIACVLCTLALFALAFHKEATELKKDEQIIFFPTLGQPTDDGGWKLQIHGWLFEPEHDSLSRGILINWLRKKLDLSPTDESSSIFAERVRPFLVDNEEDKTVVIRIASKDYTLPPTAENGHFQGEIVIPPEQAKSLATDDKLTRVPVEAVLGKKDTRQFHGSVLLLPREGVSVISDIDDTVKISEVLDKKALLSHTFLKPFEPTPGIAELYARLEKTGATFHYVSASPWQLYEHLAAFCREAKLPNGTFHLVPLRLKDSSALDFAFNDSEEKKRPAIERIIRAYPKRKFILIGDSGESDPEIYGKIARQFPEQVIRILIRDVRGQDQTSSRMLDAFEKVPADRWTVFKHPNELAHLAMP